MSYRKVALRLGLIVSLLVSAVPRVLAQDQQDPSSKPRNVKPELKKAYKDWLDKDVTYIITDEERKAFKKLATDDERERFIEEFWRRRDPDPSRVDGLLRTLRVRIAPVSADQGNLALNAFLGFGKGRHSAALNLADCFAYALAKSRNLPLLFKGADFSKTDIVPAWQR